MHQITEWAFAQTGFGRGLLQFQQELQKEEAAKQFIEWATSNGYIELVAANEGWANVPPGARTSLYENANYKDIPFAKMTLDSILTADPNNSTVDESPYVGIQFAAIPEFAAHSN